MSGLKLNQADLDYILKQIKISEAHAAGIPLTSIVLDAAGEVVTNPAATNPDNNNLSYYVLQGGVYVPRDPAQPLAIPDPKVPYGLRTVDGSDNNIVPGREQWGASGEPMPRLFAPNYINDADGDSMDFGPGSGPALVNGNYGAPGSVVDADPRTISNLVVDLSLNNPAAILAALTYAGSEDPMGDLNEILALKVTPTEATAALTAAQNLLTSQNLALDAAVQAYTLNPNNLPVSQLIDAIQNAAEAVTAAEAEVAAAQQLVSSGSQSAMIALAEEKGLVFENGSLVLPNVAPDEGLSAPFNAWMTFFGQFFDHGLDLISKGGNGTVYVPLADDDPLVLGADGMSGTADDLAPHLRFMAVTRSTTVTNADGEPSQRNVTTPFVDQNQTYTSHASHQVFLREYVMVGGKPMATGKLLGGEDGGLATWADVKAQAKTMLGINLTDADVGAVPLLRTDAYGEFIRDPNTGFAQVIVGLGADGIPNTADDVVVSGTPSAPVSLANAVRTANAFLDDIAHNAVPVIVGGALQADADFFDANGQAHDASGAIVTALDITGNDVGADPQTGRNLEYDNELLDRHYITGDGRGNENIGLTAVHHVFHSEHNRQVDQQKVTILLSGDANFINEWFLTDPSAAEVNAFVDGYNAATNKGTFLANNSLFNSTGWDGERLFQAGRFATEMQYQHLVFEEFARKIQPEIDAFVFNSVTDIDPSIFSEFANVIYRFGHSMLTESMPRIDGLGNLMDEDLGLVESFLNPVLFDNNGGISHDEGAAAIVRGMTIERGAEIDEFITGALRNNLLGLPLDLAAINIARGRDTGMPTLNQAREQLYAATGSSFLTPYTSWTEFAANLKNPLSVVNFIAAYGTHAAITGATTLEAKRAAAWEIVFGVKADGVTPTTITDRVAYLNSTDAWASAETGLNNIDLWIGGLAEKKMPFGGMLGSTFNAVFEAQLEALQDGDRFYYLTRTQGQNFLTMLEQNSFAKLIMANTDLADPGPDGIRGTGDDIIERHIGVDSFAAYDFVLEVNAANQADYDPTNASASGKDPTGNDPVLEAMGLGKVVRDDPGTAGPDANYIRFSGGEHVVIGGTNGNDTIIADFGDDGIWGDAGDDRIESGAGVDLVNGGAGNDIITDSGDTGDFLKGDEGDDVIANSNGLDIIMGGTGNDVVFVGVDSTEVFGGEGDDFIAGGDGADFLLGGEGDDWMEAGGGFDTTAGDNSELFFNSAIKGHDVMFAGNDEHDFDAESGDDIMVQGESVIRNEGMFGFDWSIFKDVNIAANADLRTPIFTTEQADILRNRFDKVEALSGWKLDDILRGDDRVADTGTGPAITAGNEGVFFNDELTQAGVDRIDGLREMLGHLVATAPAGATAEQLEALVAFNSGNILLGGAGSDTLQGNGGDDFLDGDAWLNVRIRITGAGEANTAANQDATVDSLRHVFTAADGVPAWVGKSLFELLIDRTIVPNQLHIVREIVTTGVSSNDVDTAVFNDRLQNDDGSFNYTIVSNADGTVTVTHTNNTGLIDPLTGAAVVDDGVDTLRNIERLQFADQTLLLSPPKLYLQQQSGQYADNFNFSSWGNSDGSTNWGPDWVESGDSGGVTTGQIQLDPGGQANNVMRFSGTGQGQNGNNGAMITRSMDLSGATTATISYTITESGFEPNEWVRVFFSADGTNFTQIEEITSAHPNSQGHTHVLTGPFSANAAIRFEVSALTSTDDIVTVDNLSISFASSPSIDFETTFTEGNGNATGADVDIASNPLIIENDRIVSARVVLTNAQDGDAFDVPTNLPGNITRTIDTSVPGQITVILTGNENNIANWQAALQQVEFRNTSQNPSTVDRIIEVTVNDGFLNSNVATTTVNVVAVNDAPNAVTDNVVTNITGAIFIPEWMMLRNDSDPEGSTLRVTGATENDQGFGINYSSTTRGVTATRTNTQNHDFTYTVNDGSLNDTADVDITWDTAGTLSGTNGADIILGDNQGSTIDGNGGDDLIIGGAGNDAIDGDTGNDEIHWNAGDGRDLVNGGTGTDTFVLNGDVGAETFRIYTRAAWLGVGGNAPNQISGATEIVVTRNGTNSASIVAELDNIEEIVVNGATASPPGGPVNTTIGGDTIQVFGNFAQTSLALNTITINGGTGDDTVDFSALSSAHRIVFRSNGGNDTIVGNVRPQDVIELPEGQDVSTYNLVSNNNGTQTFSNGTHSVTFTGTVAPQFQNAGSGGGDDSGNGNDNPAALQYTAADLAGLKALVNGLPPDNGEDNVPTGVRTLSGHGNNLAHPEWGAADEPFTRITTPHYGAPDSAGNLAINPVFQGLDPRVISDLIGTQEDGLPLAGNGANIFFMAMGQYLDHGLDFIGKGGNGTIQIGAPGGGAPGSGNPADLTRATVSGYADGVPYHNNYTSPFVDQNQAYGSNTLVGTFLREGDGQGGVGAHLLAGAADPSSPEFKLLPTLRELIQHHWANDTVFTDDLGQQTSFRDYFVGLVDENGIIDEAQLPGMVSNFMGSGHALLLDANPYINLLDHYVAGDGRANENMALTSIHTIWARNHNLHVAELEAAGFQGTAEELFQAAKIINEVEYQRVIFNEYAQTLLGGLRGDGDHGFDGYDETVNPGISHEFAGAVFRFGHSLIGQTMTVLDADGNPMQVSLFDAFLNPTNDADAFTLPLADLAAFGYVPQPGYEQNGVSNIIGGIVQQPAEDVDVNLVDAVRNDLVRINADLFAINQARGWDLGIGTLNQVRRDLMNSEDPHVQESVSYAGDLSPYTSWEDFQVRNGLSDAVIAQFKAAFPDLVLAAADIAAFQAVNPDIELAMQSNGTGIVKGIDRVDLWLGGLAEKHINGGIVGQTYWVVLQDQFDRLQDGDRFYYLDRVGDFDFYEQFIKEQTFADIVARNTGLTGLPEDMFSVGGPANQEDEDNQDEDEGEDDGDTPVGGGDDEDDAEDEDDDAEDNDDDTDDEDDDDADEDDDDTDTDEDDDDDDADDGDVDEDDGGVVTPTPAGSPIAGTLGDDVLIGTSGDDIIFGMSGNDGIIAGAGADIINGAAGADFIEAGDGRDVIFAGEDDDQVFGGADDDLIYGDGGADRLFGGAGDDMITGGAGNDTVFGNAGDDHFVAELGDGDDVYFGDDQNGGTGIDTLDMSATTSAATVDLGTGLNGHGSAQSAQTGNDSLWSIENVVTGSGSDTIIASDAVNVIDGGAGADIFKFRTIAAADGDTIVGFEPGDRIDLTGIDANSTVAGDQSFQLVNGANSTGPAQLVVTHETREDGEYTVVSGHVDAGGSADFELNIKGHHALTATDFNL